MSFFGSRTTSSYTLSIALKSSSLDVQLISTSHVGKKEVVFAERRILVLKNSQDPQQYTTQCLQELSLFLKAMCKEMHQKCNGKLTHTRVVLYTPWFTSRITPLMHKGPIVLSEKFLVDQLKTIQIPQGLVPLEKKVIKILTNGYTITQLAKEKFTNVAISVYSSYMAHVIHSQLVETIKDAVPMVKKIQFTTSPMMIFNQIKTHLAHEDNVTFLYVGGEITEVGVIEDDTLSYYATYPIGKHDFLRQIDNTVRTYDYDMLYKKEIHLKSDSQQKMFDTLKDQWSQMAFDSLRAFRKDFPSKMLIISDSKTENFFTDLIVAKLKGDAQVGATHYRIINFDISALKDIISYTLPTYAQELDLQLEALIKN